MSEEYCAGVRILIERMATNPEDFADGDYDYANMRTRRETKFGRLARMFDQLLTGKDKSKLLESWAEWHYLTEAEQDALLTAYKQLRRVEFDKRIMERVFDEKFYERQEEEERQHLMSKTQHAQVRAQMSNTALQNTLLVNPAQNQIAHNNTNGLIGALGSALGFGTK